MRYRFSVFTATYNRAYLLGNVYRSLLAQTFKDFEWIIVDDGSTDNTESVCRTFIEEGIIPIKYIKHKKNAGKHTAWRTALSVMEGLYEWGADDDDEFSATALEIFNAHWSELEKQECYNEFWEIRARCSSDGVTVIGPKLPSQQPFYDSDYNTINYCLGFNFIEMDGCRKVEVLNREASVPESFLYDEYCSNFGEMIRWSRAARKYKTRFIEDIVRVYKPNEKGLVSSNSGENRDLKKTYNSLVTEIYALNEQHDLFLKYRKVWYLKTIFVFAYHNACVRRYAIKYLNYSLDKVLAFLLMPFAYLLYLIRR